MRPTHLVVAGLSALLVSATSAAPALASAVPAYGGSGNGSTWRTPISVNAQRSTPTTVPEPSTSADPAVPLQGRGFGHGRGMSQWGALGAAQQGRTVAQILAFYYPNTTVGQIGNPTIRVRLTEMLGRTTAVRSEAGLTLTDGTCTAALNRADATSWRVLRSNGQWQVQGYWTNTSGTAGWWTFPTSCTGFATASGLMFVGDGSLASSVLTLVTPNGDRRYAGGLRATIDNRPGVGQVATVNHLALDRYLQAVVPAEMPGSWHVEALKSQSVAARSYAAARLGSTYSSDICDTTTCQVYPGLTTSYPPTTTSNAAVAATSGQVLRYGTSVAMTEFGSTNGGQITGSSLPYQVAKADPYDGLVKGAPTAWSTSNVRASTLKANWPAIGTFRSMSVKRDGKGTWFGGRATSVTLTGTSGSVTVGAETFRGALGLRSTWFAPVGSSVGTDFAVNGFSDLLARDASGTLWNYPSTGRGGFFPRTVVATNFPASAEILAPGDFSGDGYPDLMTRTTAGDLMLHRGDGAGKIASSVLVSRGWQVFNLVVAPGDLDGNGTQDLLARDGAGTLWLYRSNGQGAFSSRTSLGGGWQAYREIEAVGDYDRDGGNDLLGITNAGTLTLLRFSSSGTFLGSRAIGQGWGSTTSLTGMGDVNGDRLPDLVARDGSGRLLAFLGNGSGAHSSSVLLGERWFSMTLAS